jgi:three-Cys-motif partner protein
MAKMRSKAGQQDIFGGAWTEEKLVCLQKYLSAYCRIFAENQRAQFFETWYVDAFAGTGYIPKPELEAGSLFPELEAEVTQYTEGSAVRALSLTPGFDRYLFIEQDAARAEELKKLKTRFPEKSGNLRVEAANANDFLLAWTRATEWKRTRAVVFLDPFGMEVDWTLIEALAETKAVDLWILFPLFATNRLLVKSGKIPIAWAARLTRVFGTSDWQKEFYETESSTLIEGFEITKKVADETKIKNYFVERLRSKFAAVAEPMILRNRKDAPLYLFCFAAGNERGAPTALKIAQGIIGS